MKNYVPIAVLLVLPLVASAVDDAIEQQVVLANAKRIQEIAIVRVPIEARYLSALQQAYKKAEAAKDLDLQVKIKKEIEVIECNVSYYKAKSIESLPLEKKKIYGVRFVNSDWGVQQFNSNGKTSTGDPFVIEGDVITVTQKSRVERFEICDDGNYVRTFRDGATYLRPGYKMKSAREILKVPEGEEINTLFGCRIK